MMNQIGGKAVTSLQTLSGMLGISFASGVNLYAAVLVAGLGVRYGWLPGLPKELEPLGHPAVLTLAAVLYLAEFVADKIPFLSAVWDSIHTLIRPLGAAWVALTAAGGLSPVEQTVAGLLGGAVAFTSHATKMGVRLLVHSSGEPFTQVGLSLAEDVAAVLLVILVSQHPYVALTVVALLLLAIAFLLPLIWRAVWTLLLKLGGACGRLFGRGAPPAAPHRVSSHHHPADSRDVV